MSKMLRPLLTLILLPFAVQLAVSQTSNAPAQTSSNPKGDSSEASVLALIPDAKRKSGKSGHADEVNVPIDKNELDCRSAGSCAGDKRNSHGFGIVFNKKGDQR